MVLCVPKIEYHMSLKVLKGGPEGTALLEQANFDHNVKEVKNAYEEYLLSLGEFDERMFLNEDEVVTGSIGASPPSTRTTHLESPVDSSSMRQARRNLVQVHNTSLEVLVISYHPSAYIFDITDILD